MAGTLLMEISQDEHERARNRSRRMYETDVISNLLTAEARGVSIGANKLAALIKEGIPLEEALRMINE
jgi:type II secretory pathway component PulF